MKRRSSVLVVGDVMIDIVVKPEGPIAPGGDRRAFIHILPGGSGANQAAWLASDDIPTTFAGRVGKADHAHQTALLAAHGVRPVLAVDETLRTGTLVTLLSADGERSFLTDRGANDRLSRDDLPDSLLDGTDHLHVSGYSLVTPGPRTAVIDLMAEAQRRNIAVSVDPASYPFLEEVGAENFLAWTRGVRLCFPNAQEAAVLACTEDREDQLDVLCRHYKIVVIKQGAQGAVAAVAGNAKRWSAPAPAIEVADSTGAGDAFLAGFLKAHLRGEGMGTCVKRAVVAGSRAVTTLGARPDKPGGNPSLPRFS
jgi:sugar/nucleoside kinase (ribokinase family)